MFSYFTRLRAKKGFTLVELVIVIAIIGILTAMVVPNIVYDKRPALGKAMAKDMYYNIQDVFTSAKIAHPEDIPAGGYAYFYATISHSGSVDKSGRVETKDGALVLSDYRKKYPDKEGSTELSFLDSKIKLAIERYTTDKDEMEGTLYIMADSNYRVCAVYWSDEALSDLQNDKLNRECVLDSGYLFCSYPIKYCDTKDSKLFVL